MTIEIPIFLFTGKVFVSIPISGPTKRITQQKITNYSSLEKESSINFQFYMDINYLQIS